MKFPYGVLAWLAVAYYLSFYTVNLVHLLLGYRAALRWKSLGYTEEIHRLSRSELVPPVSIVIDLAHMGEDPVQWVDHVLSQRFPELEMIVMCQGEGCERMEALINAFFLRRVDRVYRRALDAPAPREVYQSDDRRINLVRVAEASRGDVLNLALELSRYPLFAVAGSGAWLEEDALLYLVRPFMEEGPKSPVLMGVEIPLQMEDKNQLPPRRMTRYAMMESLRVQLGYMAGAPYLGGPVAVYGHLTVYRKPDLLRCGGFRGHLDYMQAEVDANLRVHRAMHDEHRRYRFVFLPRVVARRPFPETWGEHVREAQAKGKSVDAALRSERGMALRRRYGILGMLQIPVLWAFVHLGPMVELAAYAVSVTFFALGKVGWPVFVAFLAANSLYPALVGVGAVAAARRELGILQGQGGFLYGYAFLTQVWFRQLTRMVSLFWRSAKSGGGDESPA